jgi:tetratricopeptide (TPR) repeat protein
MTCDESPKTVNAMIIILGRHANANSFHSVSYGFVKEDLKNTVCGGYVGIVSSEGTPNVLRQYYNLGANTLNRNERKHQIDDDIEIILAFLRDENNRAKTSENDLLNAIQLANIELGIIEKKATQSGKLIGEKKIIIMDAGIVTTGALDFSRHGIDKFDFSVSDSLVSEFTSVIAKDLIDSRELIDTAFKDVNVTFIGFGDVAPPQKELSRHVENGLKILWTTIFDRANAKSVEIFPISRTRKANVSGFPEVRPIEFFEVKVDTIKDKVLGTKIIPPRSVPSKATTPTSTKISIIDESIGTKGHMVADYTEAIKQDDDITTSNKHRLKQIGYLIENGNLSEAEMVAAEVRRTDPFDFEGLMAVAYIQRLQNKLDESIETYKLVSFGKPDYAPAYFGRAESYLAMKEYERAEEYYKKAINANPKMVRAELGLAKVYKTQGKKELLTAQINKVKALGPNSKEIQEELSLLAK